MTDQYIPDFRDGVIHETLPENAAAIYVRMSTEHQNYSIGNQYDRICLYAAKNALEIIKVYADEGKSGLTLLGRPALRQLLSDVKQQPAKFKTLIVYDISRWGRFQDLDEAASYELQCRKAGVSVVYCAEQFKNDGSIGSAIIKSVKRIMASEYSRELSNKVYEGQVKLVRAGFWQGGSPGYGLRRAIVDRNGQTKIIARAKETKRIATDRVILVPGPASEVAIVNDIYHMFIDEYLSMPQIVRKLNRKKIVTDTGRQWTRDVVKEILTNERYIGNNVWGKKSQKLKGKYERLPKEQWIIVPDAFAPLVSKKRFAQAQAVTEQRRRRLSDEHMLAGLSNILHKYGKLSRHLIDADPNCPNNSSYSQRFGSLRKAYARIGHSCNHNYDFVAAKPALVQHQDALAVQICKDLEHRGGVAIYNDATKCITLNNYIEIHFSLLRFYRSKKTKAQWNCDISPSQKHDIFLLVQMDECNKEPLSYLAIPGHAMPRGPIIISECNTYEWELFRIADISAFLDECIRAEFSINGQASQEN